MNSRIKWITVLATMSLLIVFYFGIRLVYADSYTVNATASISGQFSPNPVLISQDTGWSPQTTAGVSGNVTPPQLPPEAQITNVSWTWSIVNVQESGTYSGTYNDVYGGYSITIPNNGSSDSGATIQATFSSWGYWQITVQGSVTITDSDGNTYSGQTNNVTLDVTSVWASIAVGGYSISQLENDTVLIPFTNSQDGLSFTPSTWTVTATPDDGTNQLTWTDESSLLVQDSYGNILSTPEQIPSGQASLTFTVQATSDDASWPTTFTLTDNPASGGSVTSDP
ncbi:MAG TPA: hypothetical protein VMG59_11640 [Phycisphaerae bacterium]|nr:hypothetical protein [Phycisphaerae bacterium]